MEGSTVQLQVLAMPYKALGGSGQACRRDPISPMILPRPRDLQETFSQAQHLQRFLNTKAGKLGKLKYREPVRAARDKGVPSDREPHASLTVHVLNILTGLPATGLAMRVLRLEDPNESWTELMKSTTNMDGCLEKSKLAPQQLKAGTYKLHFETGPYWHQQGHRSFYPYVEVVFTITEEERKVHIPLLLSPYSYTTYRGS